MIQEFEAKILDFFRYVRESKAGERLIVKIKSDVSESEMKEFLEQLTSSQFIKLAEWLEHMPKVKEDVKFKCKKCGTDNNHTLEGMQSFF